MFNRIESPAYRKFIALFGIAMVLFYLCIGCLFIFKLDVFPQNPHWSQGMGCFLVLYAALRAYRVYTTHKNADNAETDEE